METAIIKEEQPTKLSDMDDGLHLSGLRDSTEGEGFPSPSAGYYGKVRQLEDMPHEEEGGVPSGRAALTRSGCGLPSIVDTLLNEQHPPTPGLTTSASSHPPPPSPTLFNPSIPFASAPPAGEPLPGVHNFLDSLSHENFQMTIVVQPPLKTVYQRILKPFPSICLNIISSNGNPAVPDDAICEGLFVEATLLRGDNGVPLPKCIDGNCVVRFERRSRRLSEGLFATFKKLKILSTSQQLQGTLLRLKFTLKKYSGNSFATIQVPNCSVISHPIEVFSHTQYLNKNREMKTPTLPQPVLDYFAHTEDRKRGQEWRSESADAVMTERVERLTDEAEEIKPIAATTTTMSPPLPSPSVINGAMLRAPAPPGASDIAMDLVRALHDFKAQGGTYQTAINWINHIYGVPSAGKLNQTTSSIPTTPRSNMHSSKNSSVSPPAPPAASSARGSGFLRSSMESVATLKSGRTSPSGRGSHSSNAGYPAGQPSHSDSPSLSGAPSSSRKRGSALSVSSPNVPVLGRKANEQGWEKGDLSGLEALATTSTQSLNARAFEAQALQEESALVFCLINDLKASKISSEEFHNRLQEHVGEIRANQILASLEKDTPPIPVPAVTPQSNKQAHTLPRKNSNRSLVHTTEGVGKRGKGRKRRSASPPAASPEDEAALPAAEKKLKLSASHPVVPTKARASATTSPPTSPSAMVQPALTEAAASTAPDASPGQLPPPEMLLAQLSTYRGPAPDGPPSPNSALHGPSSPQSSSTPSSSSSWSAGDGGTVNRWYWKNDDMWEPYSDEICRQLEKAYSQHTVCYIILENIPYKMDFKTMIQSRMDNTKRWRHIRRD